MADAYTCRCGFVTRICRDEVTAEQWNTFESLHRLAYAWAVDHLWDGDAEQFAVNFAGEFWDTPDDCPSFPAVAESERAVAQRAADARKAEESALARAKDRRDRAARRRAARKAA